MEEKRKEKEGKGRRERKEKAEEEKKKGVEEEADLQMKKMIHKREDNNEDWGEEKTLKTRDN